MDNGPGFWAWHQAFMMRNQDAGVQGVTYLGATHQGMRPALRHRSVPDEWMRFATARRQGRDSFRRPKAIASQAAENRSKWANMAPGLYQV